DAIQTAIPVCSWTQQLRSNSRNAGALCRLATHAGYHRQSVFALRYDYPSEPSRHSGQVFRGQPSHDRHAQLKGGGEMKRRNLVVRSLVATLIVGSLALASQTTWAVRPYPVNMNSADNNAVLLPNRSPLVSFRILFMTGSAYDPAGKEGLASLTA